MTRSQLNATTQQNNGGTHPAFLAGKNKIINGDFGVWQRGTSFTATGYLYTADRWLTYGYGSATTTVSQQSFTAGTAPVSGYEGTYFMRVSSTTTSTYIGQRIEDVRTLANQTVTVSFWAKSATPLTNLNVALSQVFGSGGSATVSTTFTSSGSVGTSWSRFSISGNVPSVSGKTIGAGSYLILDISSTTLNNNFDIWGVQVEAGSVATPFTTATGTMQGELAACQRYYVRNTTLDAYGTLATSAMGYSTTNVRAFFQFPVTMRIAPTSLDYSLIGAWDTTNVLTATSVTLDRVTTQFANISCNFASGITQYRPFWILANNSASAYLGFSAEL